MKTINQPLSWYVDKLERDEPFTSLLYGDGEFLVAAGRRSGHTMQNGEVVTEELEWDMRESLTDQSTDIIRGTDPFIADPDSYGGQDVEAVREMHSAMAGVANPYSEWYDGTVWERAVRDGELGPLVKVLRSKSLMVVANGKLLNFYLDNLSKTFPTTFITVPDQSAAAELDHLERESLHRGPQQVYVICAGLATIPLIMRLRRKVPDATFLDLGSTFDIFAREGSRGWMKEVCADGAIWKALVDKNLGGVK